MIQGKKKVNLSMDSILDKLSEFDLYMRYMPHKNWELNEVCISPFPKSDGSTERNPSFLIGNKRGYLSHILFSNTYYRGDCFAFIKQLYHLSTLDDVLRKIDKDFNLGIVSGNGTQEYKKIVEQYKQPEITKRNVLIQATTRKFTKEELDYWNQYHIDIQELRENNVYSIKNLYLNKKIFYLKPNELRFGYFYDGHWKIYRPHNSKKEKWMPNNVSITALDGKDNIKSCDTAFINKSKKDLMIIRKVFPCSIGIQNEGIACFSPENVEYIKSNSKRQILSFDADITGVKNSQQITELFGFGYCNVPRKYLQEGLKDWEDVAKAYNIQEIEKILKEKGII